MEHPKPLTYRTAGLQDQEQLKQLGIASYGQYKTILTQEHWEKLNGSLHDDEKIMELLGKAKCFVCLDEEQIIGMAYLVPHNNPWDIFKAEWSYIRMVGVHPTHAGRGIAKTLTQMCIAHAKETDEQTIALHTSEFMDAARHIYESLGFRQVMEMEPRLGKRYWLYMLDIG
jgi:ribosomal protein S18 acetylase RimI-like enzyme